MISFSKTQNKSRMKLKVFHSNCRYFPQWLNFTTLGQPATWHVSDNKMLCPPYREKYQVVLTTTVLQTQSYNNTLYNNRISFTFKSLHHIYQHHPQQNQCYGHFTC